ncbi:hypothetical protein EIP86_002795 [Pleurotus ostreatoroseus]|nr:hypothetical protein EIP86_002795 [Pleurotus ostreatoroseus]
MNADTAFRTVYVATTASLAAADRLPLPGIGAIVYLANEIIAAIATSRCNKADAKELLDEIAKDKYMIFKAYELKEVRNDTLFNMNICMIVNTLQDVLEMVRKISARRSFEGFLCSGKDRQRIVSAKENLQRVFQRFEACTPR